MEVTIAAKTLNNLLSLAGKAQSSAVSRPILKMVEIKTTPGGEGEDGSISVAATDLQTYARISGPAAVWEPGVVVLDPARLRSVLSTVTTDDVDLSTTEDGACVVHSGDAWWELRTHDPSEWVVGEEAPDEHDLTVAPVSLKGAYQRTAYATADEKGRYALNGLLWQADEDGLTLVGADGARLAVCECDLEETPEDPWDVIVPPDALQLALDACTGQVIEMAVEEGTLYMMGPQMEVRTQLVEGQFPNWREVFPREEGAKTHVTADREELQQAFRQASVVTTDAVRAVDWEIKEAEGLFGAQAPDVGESRVTTELDVDGEEMTVSFNAEYLLDLLDAHTSDTVTIHLTDYRSPVMIDPGENTRCVISPVVKEDSE